MPTLAADIDLTSVPALLLGGVVALAGAVALLWRVSRTDKDALLAAKDAELKSAAERERAHIEERAKWVEVQLRAAKALEAIEVRLQSLEQSRREAVRP